MTTPLAPSGPDAPSGVHIVEVDPKDPKGGTALGEGVQQAFIVGLDFELDPSRFADATARLAAMVHAGGLERTIEVLTPDLAIPSAAVVEQARRNVALRERLLHEFGAVTARELADLAGSGASNRSQYAHSLSRAGRIFSVTHRRQVVFPGFQFASDGEPLPIIALLLPVLRERFTSSWEVAVWFAAPNSWLDGARPVDLLGGDPEAVLSAASAGATRGGW